MEHPFSKEIAAIFGKGTVVVDCDQWMNISKIEKVGAEVAPTGTMTTQVGGTTIVYRITKDPSL